MTRAADLAKLIAGGGSITVSDNSENLKLITTDADASVGPTLRMDRQSASAADSDLLGKINFVGHNDAGTPEDIGYAGITAIISDASDGTEDGKLAINTMVAGTERSRIFVDAGETVFNEDSIDVDFRIESDSNSNMFFVDGGNNSVGIGDSAPPSSVKLAIQTDGVGLRLDGTANTTRTIFFRNTTTSNPAQILADGSLRLRTEDASTAIIFNTNSSGTNNEAMRIDGSQRVIVGKDSNSSSTAGTTLYGNGKIEGVRDGDVVHSFNRLSSDGTIVSFQKDGSTVGSIVSGPFSISASGVNNTGWSFGDNSAIEPMKNSATADNLVDLGSSSKRMDDIHATNGTIQTSDENEKQDIASMTTAELAVGKRLSTLFKTFRWKDKVTEKADKARTHSGIVAQQVKEAFEAEGLDATKYALFCSDTWWEKEISVDAVEADEEKGIEAKDAYTYMDIKYVETEGYSEKTRLGVRYPELLSFIASYNESRFTAIEARLTALEK